MIIRDPKGSKENTSFVESHDTNERALDTGWSDALSVGVVALGLLGSTGLASAELGESSQALKRGSYTPPPAALSVNASTSWNREIDQTLSRLREKGIPLGYLIDTISEELGRVYAASRALSTSTSKQQSVSEQLEQLPFIIDPAVSRVISSIPLDLSSPQSAPPTLFLGPGDSARTEKACLLANEASGLTFIHQKLVKQSIAHGIYDFSPSAEGQASTVPLDSVAHIERAFAQARNIDLIYTAKWFERRVSDRYEAGESTSGASEFTQVTRVEALSAANLDHLRAVGHQMQLTLPGIFSYAKVAAGAGTQAISVEAARYNLAEQIQNLVLQYDLGQSSLGQVHEVLAADPSVARPVVSVSTKPKP